MLRLPDNVPATVVTVRPREMLWVNEPAIPVSVSTYVPKGVAAPTVTVNVALPSPVIAPGVMAALAPVGRPIIANVTVPPRPFTSDTVIVYDRLPFDPTICDAGVALIEKSGAVPMRP